MSSAPSGDSEGDEEETTQDEVSSHTSEEDGGVVKVERELDSAEAPVGSGDALVEHEVTENLNSDPLLELCQCPLCQLDCGSREQLIAHVYQVWNGDGALGLSASSLEVRCCGGLCLCTGSSGYWFY